MSKLSRILVDTWRGLVQRRLWPVAVVLLAGLVAVPLLLTSTPEPVEPPLPTPAAVEAAELAAQPLVTVASAAERESARRVLGKRKDPFKPTGRSKRKKSGGDAAGSASESSASKTSNTSSKPTSSSPSDDSPEYGGGAYAPPAPEPSATRPDRSDKQPKRPAGSLSVRWGIAGDEDLERLEVERLDPLPDPDHPLLVYLGLSEDRRTAVFMLDAGVTVDGDGRCRPDPADCQSVELAPGETEFVEVADENGSKVQYQLDLVKIHGRNGAQTPTKDAAAAARVARRALRSLGRTGPAYRFDARAGTLKRIGPTE